MKNLIKITSNCPEYKETGIPIKKIKRISVTRTNKFSSYKQSVYNLDEAYILAFKLCIFGESKVEITVLFFI